MPVKLSTTISDTSSISNPTNSTLIHEFYQYMKSMGTSENYQNGNLKIIIYFAKFVGPTTDFYSIQKKEQILAFLDTRIKNTEIDPDKRWIRTWNDYLQRIKYFFRWLYNKREREVKELEVLPQSDRITPDGEGEIPHEAKTGTGPILLTCSFPYVRDWLNEHPFKNDPNARLICNLYNGSPITADSLWTVMKQLRTRIIRLIETGSITDNEEHQRLEYLLKTKKWNPYCIRHSAITSDSATFPFPICILVIDSGVYSLLTIEYPHRIPCFPQSKLIGICY